MRLTRRGMLAGQSSGAKFIWAVYSLTYGADESTTPYTGSFNLSSSTTYKMAASAYTATATTFTLTNPVQTTRANLKVGDYLVNVSTSSNTATSGNYLYKITGISGSTISYIRWTPTISKKDTYLYDVSAEEQLYPINGIQDGYWYVMVKGVVTVYVWNVYNAVFVYGWKEYYSGRGRRSFQDDGTNRYGNAYTFDKATGIYTITNPVSVTREYARANPSIFAGKYLYGFSSGNTDVYYDPTGYDGQFWTDLAAYYRTQDTSYIISANRGATTGTTVESDIRSTYPDDSYAGNFWYVYSHSYEYKI